MENGEGGGLTSSHSSMDESVAPVPTSTLGALFVFWTEKKGA